MVSTSIFSEGTVYFAGQKRWVKDYFHVFDRAVSMGKELPDGTIADKNYIWLSEWQLENINSNHQLPIDIVAYRQLKNHIAKALVPLLQIWLYASRDDGSFSKRYDELCEILHVRHYRQRSRIKEQFGPSLDELKAQGYLAEWSVEATSDRKAYKIVLKHGEKFHRDRRHRLGEPLLPDAMIESVPVDPSVEQGGEEGSVDSVLLEALTKRGVSERQARQVLATVSSAQEVQDQLEWADHVVSQGDQRIINPAGFYVSVIRDHIVPPDGFETSSKRRLKEEAAKALEDGQREEARLRRAYGEYLQGETDHEIGRLGSAEHESRLTLKVEALTRAHATFAVWSADQRRRIVQTALAKDVRSEISYRLFDFATFCRVQKLVAEPLGPLRQAQQTELL